MLGGIGMVAECGENDEASLLVNDYFIESLTHDLLILIIVHTVILSCH